jgi:RHS repeat-associated protein
LAYRPSGREWRDAWHRALVITDTTATVVRADGRQDIFTKSGTTFTVDPDVTSRLTAVLSGTTITAYKLTTDADVTETYSAAGRLLSITTRNGQTTTLTYSGNNLVSVTGPFGHVMRFTYTSGGQVAMVTGPDGRVYTYGYDSSLNLISVTYPDGAVRRYVYEIAVFPHLLSGIVDEKGVRYATWTYDSVARAISSQHAGGVDLTTVSYTSDSSSTVTDARGTARVYGFVSQFDFVKPASLTGQPLPSLGGKAFTYDANGFIASRTDYDGNVTTFTHDARGNETLRVEASGTPLARTISTSWLSTFHLPKQITEPNRSTAFTYDSHGNLLNETITAGTAIRSFAYTYTAFGQVLTATDPRGNITQYAYDAKGDLTSVTDALGHVTSVTSYDGNGRPLTIIDPNGVTTSLTYDLRGRLTSRTVATLTTSFAYDKAGNLKRVAQPDGSYLIYTHDQAHRLTGIADALGDHIAYTLDAASNLIMEQAFDPSGMLSRTRSYTYNAVNRLKETIGAQGQITVYAHDKQGNLTAVTDPLNHVTSYAYDALNRLTEAIDAKGGTTFFRYNAHDDLKSVTDPRNLLTAYKWDGLDDQTAIASPDTGVTSNTFDAAGNVASSTDARGNTTTYSYDALNRVTKATFADGTSTVWKYDQGANGIGRLTKIKDVTGSTVYSYDVNGHVTQKIQTVGAVALTMTYGHDAGGRLASITYPSGKQVVYAYDAAGRVSSVTKNGNTLATGVTYLPFGMAAGWTEGNGASYLRTFDLNGQITGLALPAADNIALSYDAASRITGRTETGFPAESFTYNALDSLHIYASGPATQTYTYDADGNRTGYATNATPPVSLAYNYDKASNRLLGIGGSSKESFTYDATGNMLSYSAPFADYSFSYDARNRQTEAFVGAIGTSWLINGLGQRIAQINASVPEFFFVYDEAGHLTGKYDGNGNPLQETAWLGDLPVAVLSPAGRFYIAPDHLGAPHQITDASGAAVWQWNHDPFGKGEPLGAFSYDLRFPGQFHDQDTHLHYNYFRDYDPRTGRYIESDPIGLAGGINTYGYVGGNPANFIDPLGNEQKCPNDQLVCEPTQTLVDYVGLGIDSSQLTKGGKWRSLSNGNYYKPNYYGNKLGSGAYIKYNKYFSKGLSRVGKAIGYLDAGESLYKYSRCPTAENRSDLIVNSIALSEIPHVTLLSTLWWLAQPDQILAQGATWVWIKTGFNQELTEQIISDSME